MSDEGSDGGAATWARWRLGPNRFTPAEIGGAFGDLGTLVPFVVGYLSVLRLDPTGVLLGLGLSMIAAGLFYRTPVPVQPMKAIGAAAIAPGAAVVTAGAVCAAGLVTGLIWLLLGATGIVRRIAGLVAPPVVRGIVLGVGLSFLLWGVEDIVRQPVIGGLGLALTFALMGCRFPVMLVLLLFGVGAGLATQPGLWRGLSGLRPGLSLPSFTLGPAAWSDWVNGILLLALPQLPLTMGNAMIAVTAEHNRLFPERRISERMAAVTTGLMNLLSAVFGGIPLCHGAGGMAGHVRFGARTGGAVIVLGLLLAVVGLFFRESALVLLGLLPRGVLGVIVCFAGLELAGAARDLGTKEEACVTLLVAGFATSHMGVALLVGVLLHLALQRRWVRL